MTNIAHRTHVRAFATAVAMTMFCGNALPQSNNDIYVDCRDNERESELNHEC